MLKGLLVDLVPFDSRFESRIREWINGPMRVWWSMDGLVSQAAHERFRAEWEAKPDSQRNRHIRFGVATKTQVPIGVFSLMRIDPVHRQAEVGAGIGDPQYWGGGFGSDAMLLVCEYAFRWLGLRRLWLITREDNVRARRQVEKCGYTLEGMRRDAEYYDGLYRHMIMYGLLREEWPGRDVLTRRLELHQKAKARGTV